MARPRVERGTPGLYAAPVQVIPRRTVRNPALLGGFSSLMEASFMMIRAWFYYFILFLGKTGEQGWLRNLGNTY
jgi:hypothetical protein